MSKADGKLLDHNYDGIQELDNKLPPWWLNLFYFTIIWAVLYLLYYHVLGMGDLQIAEYQKEMNPNWKASTEATSSMPGYVTPLAGKGAERPNVSENEPSGGTGAAPVVAEKEEVKEEASVNYEPFTDAASLEEGHKVFIQNCAACHGQKGEGIIGPNLTDKYWLHGDGSFNAIVKVIQEGVPTKGMIAWKPVLPEEKLLQAASYILSLKGSNPPNGKAPQGEAYGD